MSSNPESIPIAVKRNTHERLQTLRLTPRESFDEIIVRLLERWDESEGPQ